MAAKKMTDYKELSKPLYDAPKSVQELIPICRIAQDGVFQLEKGPEDANKLFDKAYLFEDAAFATKSPGEQEESLKLFCQLLNSLDTNFKIIIMNNSRDFEKMRRDFFIRFKDEHYRDICEDINHQMADSFAAGGNLECIRIFVITCREKDVIGARNHFRSIEANLMQNFSRLGSVLIPLDAEARFKYLFSFYHAGEEADYDFSFEDMIRRRADFRDYIAPRMVRYDRDEYGQIDGTTLQIDGRFVRAMYLSSMPPSLTPGIMQSLTSGLYNLILTVDVAAVPAEAGKKRLADQLLKNGREIEKQQEARNKAWAFSSDISYEKRREKDELESALDIMNENNEKFFYTGIYAVISAPSRQELEKDVQSFLMLSTGCGLNDFQPAYYEQLEAVDTALPVGVRRLSIMRALFTQPLAALTPFVAGELNDRGGIFYGINQITKNVLIGDRKLLKNGNGFILGVSGGGKDVLSKIELIQVLLRTDDVIMVVDPQNEYKEIAEAMGGQFIDFGAGSDHYINPLDTETIQYMENKRNFMSDKMDLLNGIFSQMMDGEIRSEYKSIISRCVMHLYEHMDEKGYQTPTLKDMYEELKGMDEIWANDLCLSMERYLIEGYDMFSNPTNVNINSRFVVFGLGNIGNEQSGIAMLIMLDNIRSRIAANARKGISTRLYIDEFHNLAKDRFSSAYLEKIWREVRKMGGLCTAITQDIADALSSRTVQVMLNNSEFLALLCQHEAEMEILSRSLGLSDTLLGYVDNSPPGCGLLKFGSKIIPMDARIPHDSLMYQLFSTNFHEKVRLGRIKKQADKNIDALPDMVREELAKAPTKTEGVFPYP